MKRTIEIDDTLHERVESAIEEVKALLLTYLNENKPDKLPDLSNALDFDGSVHETIDGSVPVYTWEIRCTWFLYENELRNAYENAGVGDDATENDGMAAIYFYLSEKVAEWYSENAQDEFNRWQQSQPQSDSAAQEG